MEQHIHSASSKQFINDVVRFLSAHARGTMHGIGGPSAYLYYTILVCKRCHALNFLLRFLRKRTVICSVNLSYNFYFVCLDHTDIS